MRKHCLYICKIGLLILSISLYACYNDNGNRQPKGYKEYLSHLEEKIKLIEQKNIGKKIQNQDVYWGHDSVTSHTLEKILHTKRLFLYFSSNTCSPCIENTIGILKELFPDYIENDNIVFISTDYPHRYAENVYGKRLLTLTKGELGLPIERNDFPPFFFIANEQLEIISIHIVNKLDLSKTKNFLFELKKSLCYVEK